MGESDLYQPDATLRNELAQARAQLAASADILKVISRSSFELQAVLDTLTQSAASLCEADMAGIARQDAEGFHYVTNHRLPADWLEYVKDKHFEPGRGTVLGRALLDCKIVHLADVLADPEYRFLDSAHTVWFRTVLGVPLMRGEDPIGVIILAREKVAPFSESQIDLIASFANQAVIAIENARLFAEIHTRNGDLTEALAQQTAANEVLSVISASPTDIQPVFDMIAERSAHLCEAEYCVVFRYDGELIHFVAQHGLSDAGREAMVRAYPMRPGRTSTTSRAILTGEVEQIPDFELDPDYAIGAVARAVNARSIASVPILKNRRPIGAINIAASKPGLFPERQIALLKTFADQAVIAIENVGLFEEVQARTSDLGEALQQQTATADVLKLISRSTFDLPAVLDALVLSITRLCEADTAAIAIRQPNGEYVERANFEYSSAERTYLKDYVYKPGRASCVGRVLLEGRTIQIPDVFADADYTLFKEQGGPPYRTVLGVPMLREGVTVGVAVVTRTQARAFSRRQVELVETFADQAVIAIENVRLFEEVQARNREVTEALERQTATSEVLRVIAASPTDIQPVLDTVVESAARLCDAYDAALLLKRGDSLVFGAHFGPIPIDFAEWPLARDWVAGRSVVDCKPIQVVDLVSAGDDYASGIAMAARLGHRTILAAPLLRKGEAIGTIILRRIDVRAFSDKQVELLKTFADQAAIAIQNVRLFEEVQTRTAELSEALQQQTATADVLKVISRSAFDLQPVLQTLLDSAVHLCGADMGGITLRDGDVLRFKAGFGASPEHLAYELAHPHPLGRGTFQGRAALEGVTVHVPDVMLDAEYERQEAAVLGNFRAVLSVPLKRGEEVIGVFGLAKSSIGPFAQRQIELVESFADQAVIAIENARLFEQVQARTGDLAEALQQQTATADALKVISRSAFDLQPVLDTLIQSAARVCEADNGVIYRSDGALFRLAADFGFSDEFRAYSQNNPHQAGRGGAVARAVLERQTIHIHDVLADPEYRATEYQQLGGYRTVLAVPLMREGVPTGTFVLTRSAMKPFSARQIELVETFADQAVIAIENVRLFDEVQARTAELARSLEDLRAAQDRLVQTEKLASLGQLTAGIAHEIKNPLNFVNNFAALSGDLLAELDQALARATPDSEARSEITELMQMLKGNVEKIEQHGKRADSIVKNMLLHSRSGAGEHRPTSINAVLEESLNLAYHGARAEKQGFNITLLRDFDPAAGEVDLYPQEITRVLLNLISNGFYATSKRGARTNGAYEPTLAASTRDLGDRVEIRIRDNGTGIPAEVREKMFDPFFTTKPAGEGTGLGLSLSHDIIVKQHAGTIEVATEPGEFTEFRIVLPRGAALTSEKEAIA